MDRQSQQIPTPQVSQKIPFFKHALSSKFGFLIGGLILLILVISYYLLVFTNLNNSFSKHIVQPPVREDTKLNQYIADETNPAYLSKNPLVLKHDGKTSYFQWDAREYSVMAETMVNANNANQYTKLVFSTYKKAFTAQTLAKNNMTKLFKTDMTKQKFLCKEIEKLTYCESFHTEKNEKRGYGFGYKEQINATSFYFTCIIPKESPLYQKATTCIF